MEKAVAHGSSIVPEKYFRWRSGEITRLEAFCDVVFGFAITLLVVSLEVPHTYAELMAAMREFLPFAACFAQLILIWRAHYRFSRRYGLEDPYTVFLNVVLLFLVLYYVYPLKFVFTLLFHALMGIEGTDLGWHEGSVLMRLYAVGFASVFFLFVLMYGHAYRLRRELQLNPVEVLETRFEIRENALMTVIGLFSFLVALRSPEWAGWVYALIGPVLWIHGSIYGKRVRMLGEKIAAEKS
ncbi:MAG: TMEM175 family protein [Candidatus Sulfotelmatobacter sp.]